MGELTSIKAQYVGPTTLNTRSLRQGLELLLHPERRRRDTISLHEVATVLGVLEALAMSPRLHYDGTVPMSHREPVDELVGELTDVREVRRARRQVTPLVPRGEELVSFVGEAATQASLLIRDIDPVRLRTSSEAPLALDHTRRFVAALRSSRNVAESDRRDLAAEFATGGLTGGKCLAGLITAQAPDGRLDAHVADLLDRYSSETDQARIVAGVINRFRSNYVNALSSEHRAAYLADPRIEDLRSQQVLLLWRYIERRVVESARAELTPTPQLFPEEFHTFPLGFALLMRGRRPPSPTDLLIAAVEEGRKLETRRLARVEVSQQRFVHALSDEEFRELEDEYLGDLIDAARRASHSHRPTIAMRTARRLVPAVLAGGLGLAGQTELAAATASGSIVITALAELAPELVADHFEGRLAGRRRTKVYADTYQKVHELLREALTESPDPARVARRIEDVFGARLESPG